MHGADRIRLRFRMSFGEREKRRNKEFSGMPGGNSEREPPDPIPNSEVKTFCADGSVAASHARVGHCQASHAKAPMLERASGPFLLAYTCLGLTRFCGHLSVYREGVSNGEQR